MQESSERVESGLKLIWRMTVLQTKYPLVGVAWPLLAALLWHAVATLDDTITVVAAYGVWRFDYLRTQPVPNGTEAQGLAELGLTLLVPILTAGLFALVGLAYGKSTLESVKLSHRANRWLPSRRQLPRYLMASSLKLFLLGWAFVAFIFPGIYLMARLMYVQHALIDKDLGVWEAFRESWRLSDRAGEGLVGLIGWLLVLGLLTTAVVTVAGYEFTHVVLVAELLLLLVFGSDYVMAQAITYAELQDEPSEAVEAAPEVVVTA